MLPNSSHNTLLSADSGYAQRRKELLALIKQLHAIGAQADLDLPRIAVIGNQSAGKSSLVEAISGITVPRDAGTCTRCPMECRLQSSSGPWFCQVSIRWEYGTDDRRKDDVREVPFGPLITDKADVELMLRRAQVAVLNPTVPSTSFLTLSAGDLGRYTGKKTTSLPFSKNVVCVDLAGPELTDLSFVDLPGIISNAEPAIVTFVESLVKSHIQGNCLILVTLPMSDDIDNAKAARFAQEQDPSGLRTIGVMTKPDTLSAGATKSRELWLDVLEGRSRPLTHGYYCTRQPDDAERAAGITAEEARAAEAAFFARTAPWATSMCQDRFGTHNLVKNLSRQLTQIIDDALPKLQEEVTQQLARCNAELERLPPPVNAEPSAYVLSLVTAFCGDVQAYVQGSSSTAGLVQQNRCAYAAYKHLIRSTAPPFIPYPSADDVQGDKQEFLQIDDDDGDNSEEKTGSERTVPQYVYLQDIKRYIQQSITRELPNNVPYPAKVALIQQFQHPWEGYSRMCFKAVDKELQQTLATLVQDKFQRYDNLRARIGIVVMELVKARREATLTYLLSLLKLETTPFTQNSHYLADKTAKALARYKDARAGRVEPEPVNPFGVFGPPMTPSKSTTPLPHPFASVSTATPAQASSSTSAFGTPSTSAPASAAVQPGPFSFGTPAFGTPSTSAKPAELPSAMTFASTAWKAEGASAPTRSKTPGFVSALAIQTPAPAPASTSRSATPTAAPTAAPAPSAEDMTTALSALAKLGYHVKAEDLGKLNPPDEYEEELQVMAEVRAYFQVAYKRVIDYVPLAIDHLFLYEFAAGLQAFLIARLELGTPSAPARCAAFLAEPANVVAQREELVGRKKRLEGVQMELFNFGL
ncbi:P-loop containing nucleoside triphosphate hydrolase protein [Amylocystis lapponica]|nr:P-loop containing nucleoside triphosphate hydrolase protein [Amylocystis lapponica]